MTITAALITTAVAPLLLAFPHAHLAQTALNQTLAISDPEMPDERLQVGDTFPNFTIATPYNPSGEDQLSLSEALKAGPVVVTFFRGSWCPYCRDELSDFQDNIEKFNELGATVIAISPEVGEKSVELAEELGAEFVIAHDQDNTLADALHLMFQLDGKTIKRYRDYGIHVGDSNGTGSWELPVPATYVIDQDAEVRFVFDDEDYRKRAKAREILKVVESISADD